MTLLDAIAAAHKAGAKEIGNSQGRWDMEEFAALTMRSSSSRMNEPDG